MLYDFLFRRGKPQVILGAHSVAQKEKLEQTFSIKRAISYPCYDPETFQGDLQLLQVNMLGFFFGLSLITCSKQTVEPETNCYMSKCEQAHTPQTSPRKLDSKCEAPQDPALGHWCSFNSAVSHKLLLLQHQAVYSVDVHPPKATRSPPQ